MDALLEGLACVLLPLLFKFIVIRFRGLFNSLARARVEHKITIIPDQIYFAPLGHHEHQKEDHSLITNLLVRQLTNNQMAIKWNFKVLGEKFDLVT